MSGSGKSGAVMTNRIVSPVLYRMTLAVAVVACAFSLLVAIMLVSTSMTLKLSSPLDLTELDQLRLTLKATPADQALQVKIRDLDWMARRFYFGGLATRQTGIYLLLGGVAVSLIALRLVVVLRRRTPDPRHYQPLPDQPQAESAARWTLAGVIVAVMTVALYMGVTATRESPRLAGTARPTGIREIAQNRASASNEPNPMDWYSFRGAAGSGVAANSNMPTFWDGANGSGIVWTAEVPLRGMSSPIVWGNKVYLTGASEERREVYCYDFATGTLLWKLEVKPDPTHVKKAPEVDKETGYAASTCVADEMSVFALFANGDLVAVDGCAQLLWSADLGLPANRYGHSSSLARYQNRILIQYDQDPDKGGTSRLMALDAGNGKALWSTPRPVSDSWPSPIVLGTSSGPQVVTVANDWIIAYHPVSGRELWKVHCAGTDVAPSPIYAGGLVLVSVTADKLYAIRPDGTGDVTASHVAWTSGDGVADVASPVSDGELLYTVNAAGMLTCLDVKSGAKVWEQGLEGEFYGSPGLAGDKLYLVSRSGQVFILKTGRHYALLGMASLGEPSDGSPVFAGDRILIRGLKTLFCIGVKQP